MKRKIDRATKNWDFAILFLSHFAPSESEHGRKTHPLLFFSFPSCVESTLSGYVCHPIKEFHVSSHV